MISIRPTEPEDAEALTRWFLQPEVLNYFPMYDMREIEDSVRIWMNYNKLGSGLSALWDGVLCGMTLLYIQPYEKLAHQCLFTILVDEAYRGRGVGTALIRAAKKLGQEKFGIEILHLEVYEGNPAINLYRREGFKEFGSQNHFIKEKNRYVGKIFMDCNL